MTATDIHASVAQASRSGRAAAMLPRVAARSTPPDVIVIRVPERAPAPGIGWRDAGIGAAGLLFAMLLALGGTTAVVHRGGARAERDDRLTNVPR